jgi:hypothetical protein
MANQINTNLKFSYGDVMVRIKETSLYRVEDEKGNILKTGFKDIEDALEYAVNYLLNEREATKVLINGQVVLTARRKRKES